MSPPRPLRRARGFPCIWARCDRRSLASRRESRRLPRTRSTHRPRTHPPIRALPQSPRRKNPHYCDFTCDPPPRRSHLPLMQRNAPEGTCSRRRMAGDGSLMRLSRRTRFRSNASGMTIAVAADRPSLLQRLSTAARPAVLVPLKKWPFPETDRSNESEASTSESLVTPVTHGAFSNLDYSPLVWPIFVIARAIRFMLIAAPVR